VLVRNDENVRRRLRVDVPEGDGTFVPVNDLGGSLARDDPAKEAILFSHIDFGNERQLTCDEQRALKQ
jgi:hypothetical protein